MDPEQSLAQAIGEQVALVAYDPTWPDKFELEEKRLHTVSNGNFTEIEHIGSTAVPEMLAKPIIDILAAVESMSIADQLLEPLCNSGYTTSADFNKTIGNRRWLMRWKDGSRTHHLHIVERDSTDWEEHLVFRDALRSNQTVALEYLQLKMALAEQFEADREAYTNAKTEFIRKSLDLNR